MNKAEIEQKADELVSKAERAFAGDEAERDAYNAITTELNKLDPTERLAVAEAMSASNAKHRLKDDSLPMLQLDGEDELTGIHIDRERSYFDLDRYLVGEFEHKDVYNIRPDKW